MYHPIEGFSLSFSSSYPSLPLPSPLPPPPATVETYNQNLLIILASKTLFLLCFSALPFFFDFVVVVVFFSPWKICQSNRARQKSVQMLHNPKVDRIAFSVFLSAHSSFLILFLGEIFQQQSGRVFQNATQRNRYVNTCIYCLWIYRLLGLNTMTFCIYWAHRHVIRADSTSLLADNQQRVHVSSNFENLHSQPRWGPSRFVNMMVMAAKIVQLIWCEFNWCTYY